MQLATESRSLDHNMSPSTYAALIDSLFQNPAPLFAGVVMVAGAAVMTALKTDVALLWPCVAFLVLSGGARAVDMHWYKNRRSILTADEAARWETRYQIGAMVYAIALGTWCTVALLFSDDAVAHMICVSVTTGYVAAGAGRTYGVPGSSMCRLHSPAVRRRSRWRSRALPITSAWRWSARCSSWR